MIRLSLNLKARLNSRRRPFPGNISAKEIYCERTSGGSVSGNDGVGRSCSGSDEDGSCGGNG